MTAGPQEIRESVLRFIASSPQGKSAVEIVRVIAEKEKISSELVRRELLNLLERGEVALRTNLKLETTERRSLVDHTAQ